MATNFFSLFFLRCLQQNYKTKVSNNTWTFLEEQIFEIPPAKWWSWFREMLTRVQLRIRSGHTGKDTESSNTGVLTTSPSTHQTVVKPLPLLPFFLLYKGSMWEQVVVSICTSVLLASGQSKAGGLAKFRSRIQVSTSAQVQNWGADFKQVFICWGCKRVWKGLIRSLGDLWGLGDRGVHMGLIWRCNSPNISLVTSQIRIVHAYHSLHMNHGRMRSVRIHPVPWGDGKEF